MASLEVYSKGQSEDATSSVTAEVALVTGHERSCDSIAFVRGVLVVCEVVATGEIGIQSPFPGAPSISSVHRCIQD